MRLLLMMLMMLIAATPAVACNPDFLVIEDWKITEQRTGSRIGADVQVNYRLSGDRGYRLIEASIIFDDALDFRLERIAVPREKALAPGEIGQQAGLYPSSTLMMAARMNREDVRVSTCTSAVIYNDGARETFD